MPKFFKKYIKRKQFRVFLNKSQKTRKETKNTIKETKVKMLVTFLCKRKCSEAASLCT